MWLAIVYAFLLIALRVSAYHTPRVISKKIVPSPPVIRKKIVVPVVQDVPNEELARIYKSIREVLNERITP